MKLERHANLRQCIEAGLAVGYDGRKKIMDWYE